MSGIEELTAALQRAYPGITIEHQHVAQSGGEDDRVWIVRHPSALVDVQVQTANGDAPFSVAPPTVATTVAAATRLIIDRLGLRSTTS